MAFLKPIFAFCKLHWEALISLASFGVAIISLIRSFKTESLQNRVNEMEIQLKQYEIEKMQKEKEDATLSEVQARVIKFGRNEYRMKIWNSGQTTAFDITARFEKDPSIIILDEGMLPYEELAPKKNFEIPLIVHTGSLLKFIIITEWKDKTGKTHMNRQLNNL